MPQHSPLRFPLFRSWSRGPAAAAEAGSPVGPAPEGAQDHGADAAAIAPDYSIVSRTNDSLGRPLRWAFFAFMTGVSLTVAVTFTWFGAWPILAWSVVELMVLAVAFLLIERRFQDWERLTVVGDRVSVERLTAGRLERREFNRLWLTVELRAPGRPGTSAPRLVLRFAGRETEFGVALPAGQRVELARVLRGLVAAR